MTRQSHTYYYYYGGSRVVETLVRLIDRATGWRINMQREIQLDVSVNLAAFFLKNIGLWISDDPSYERRRKVILVYTMWCIMLSSIVISRDVYFTWFYNGVSINYQVIYIYKFYNNNVTLLKKKCEIISK